MHVGTSGKFVCMYEMMGYGRFADTCLTRKVQPKVSSCMHVYICIHACLCVAEWSGTVSLGLCVFSCTCVCMLQVGGMSPAGM